MRARALTRTPTHARLACARAGSGICEVCKTQAWELSLAALREAAAKRAAAAAAAGGRPGGAILPPGAERLVSLQERWEATENARVRLLLADVAILLGLFFSVVSGAVARKMGYPASGLSLFVSFIGSASRLRPCATACPLSYARSLADATRRAATRATHHYVPPGAILVTACRQRLATSLRWFTSRSGLCVLTVIVSLSLLGYVYNSMNAQWGTGELLRSPPPAACGSAGAADCLGGR
jgi:hypothetical protein